MKTEDQEGVCLFVCFFWLVLVGLVYLVYLFFFGLFGLFG